MQDSDFSFNGGYNPELVGEVLDEDQLSSDMTQVRHLCPSNSCGGVVSFPHVGASTVVFIWAVSQERELLSADFEDSDDKIKF